MQMENPYLAINERFDKLESLIFQAIQKPEPKTEPETFDLPGLMSFLKAKGLPIKKSGIYKATMRRELRFSKFGRSLIFSKSDVLEWIAQNTHSERIPANRMTESLAHQANKKQRSSVA